MIRMPGAKTSSSLRVLIALGVFLAISWLALPQAEARPKYMKIFQEVYQKEFKDAKLECSMCHMGKDKLVRNCYAQALAKELGKNVSDEAKIADAMRAIEKGSCKCGEWGKRIHEGKVPCKGCKSCMESAFDGPVRALVAPNDLLHTQSE